MHLLFSAYLIFFIAARQKIGHFNAILQFFVCFVFMRAILYIKIFILVNTFPFFRVKKAKTRRFKAKAFSL